MEPLVAYDSSESEDESCQKLHIVCENLPLPLSGTSTCLSESQNVNDFFSLTSHRALETEASPVHEQQSSMLLAEMHKNLQSSQNFEIDFWNTVIPAIDWTCPENIWKLPTYAKCHDSGKSFRCNTVAQENITNESSHLKHYVPKRQRNYFDDDKTTESTNELPVKLAKSYFTVHPKIAPCLRGAIDRQTVNRPPRNVFRALPGHSAGVNCVNWCIPEYGHLLLSAGMDGAVHIWNAFSTHGNPAVQTIKKHSKGVRGAVWSSCGRKILTCSYDNMAKICDVENAKEISTFQHSRHVLCTKYNPINHNLFLTGLEDLICGWDSRCSSKPVRLYKYKDRFGQVQDICFLNSENHFVSCCDFISRDSADRNLMVWDFASGAVLSNQIFHERYTCTRLRCHPTDPCFFAQTHGNYIAEFSSVYPYRINKCKRFEGHKVAGYNVGCDVSPNGGLIVSGDADGSLVLYDCRTAKLLSRLPFSDANDAILDVAWHPVLFSTVASSSWAGNVIIWQ